VIVRAHTLAERLSVRLRELSEKRGFRNALAKRLRVYPSAITPYVSGEREMSMDMLEAVSELAAIPLAELVAPPGSLIKQLDADEAALLRHLRKWPKSVIRNLCQFVGFFADEDPAETQARNLHELYRGLRANDRDWLYSAAVMLREKALPPDLQQGLSEQLVAELRRAEGDRGKTKRSRPET
jgi:transcriptional regulator with XRE-family HTH domain